MKRDIWKAFVAIVASVAIFAVIDGAFRSNSEKAIAFFGAFTAAIVAAITVIISTYLQADLKRRQDAENRRIDILADAVEIYAWLSVLADALKLISMNLQSYTEIMPGKAISIQEMRRNVPLDLRERIRNRLVGAARVPQPMGSRLVGLLHQVDSALDFIAYHSRREETADFTPEFIHSAMKIAEFWAQSTRYRRAKLGEYLISEGFLDVLDNYDMQALAEGPPQGPSTSLKNTSIPETQAKA